MARPLRVELPGAFYLVTARTLPRQKLFRGPDEVADFLGRLPGLGEAFGVRFHGFCLLPNHYHLIVETPRANLSRTMHRLNAGYTATVNAQRRRRGPLLQTRYRSVVFDEEPWLVRLSVHTHLNPVRKKLAATPWGYGPSSARAFASQGEPIPGLTTERVLTLAGGREAYGRLLDEGARRPPAKPWRSVWRQVALGGDDLRRRVMAALEGRNLRELAGFSDDPGGLPLGEILEVVSEHTGLTPDQLRRGKFQRVLARKAAIYLARRFTSLKLREIGEAFGVDYTTVHMAARRVEELRAEDSGLDEWLGAMSADVAQRLESFRNPGGRGAASSSVAGLPMPPSPPKPRPAPPPEPTPVSEPAPPPDGNPKAPPPEKAKPRKRPAPKKKEAQLDLF